MPTDGTVFILQKSAISVHLVMCSYQNKKYHS